MKQCLPYLVPQSVPELKVELNEQKAENEKQQVQIEERKKENEELKADLENLNEFMKQIRERIGKLESYEDYKEKLIKEKSLKEETE